MQALEMEAPGSCRRGSPGPAFAVNMHFVLHVFLLLTLLTILYKYVVGRMETRSCTDRSNLS